MKKKQETVELHISSSKATAFKLLKRFITRRGDLRILGHKVRGVVLTVKKDL